MKRGLGLVTLLLAVFTVGRLALAEPARVAVFDFELVDTSLQGEVEGVSPDDQARLTLISADLRDRLQASGRYEVVDVTPIAGEIEASGYLRSCNGCEARLAQAVDADLALIGWVQKVSNLILNINVGMRDAATGEQMFVASVDIRGNTDESWLHGIRYLVKNRLLKE